MKSLLKLACQKYYYLPYFVTAITFFLKILEYSMQLFLKMHTYQPELDLAVAPAQVPGHSVSVGIMAGYQRVSL